MSVSPASAWSMASTATDVPSDAATVGATCSTRIWLSPLRVNVVRRGCAIHRHATGGYRSRTPERRAGDVFSVLAVSLRRN